MRALVGFVERLCAVMAGAAAVALCGILLVTAASVVMRKVVGAPLPFTEELAGLLLCASLFLALPQVTLSGRHVQVALLAERASARGRRVLGGLAALVLLGFCAWFLLEGLPWLAIALRRAIRSEASNLLLWPWMALPVVSIAVCGLLALLQLLGVLRPPDSAARLDVP
jgi:TRAP-type C4-dicarboxylate transport system permease small subunit